MSFESARSYARAILQPLGILSDSNQYPELRTPLLPPSTSKLWKSTTHTFLGTSNRITPSSWPVSKFKEDPNGIPFDTKHDKYLDSQTENLQKAAKNSIDANFWLYERENSPLGENGGKVPIKGEIVPQPILVVKRYIPNNKNVKGSGLTLLILPGMGVPKEMFEPMIEILLPKLNSSNVNIEEIWALDMPMSGESALANPPGYLYGNEKDITRDILLFLTAYLPTNFQKDLPERLPFRKPKPDGLQNTRKGLHVISHSLGAQAGILCAAHAPQLFESITIFDPAMYPMGKIGDKFAQLPSDIYCTNLPEFYESREELRQHVMKNKRTQGWDPRIVDVFVERGAIKDSKSNKIRLTAPPRLEWALYYDKETPIQACLRFQDLTIPINAIMPSRPFAIPPKMFEDIMNAFPQTKKNLIWIPKTSHQIVHEKVDECAEYVHQWLKGWSSPPSKSHL